MRRDQALRHAVVKAVEAVAFSLPAITGLFGVSCRTPPAAREPPVLVQVVRLKRGPALSTYQATGEVRAKVESNLSFRVAGKVNAREADIGERVKEGALLARLDPQQQRADVEVAQAAVKAAAAGRERLNQELLRQRELFASGAVAKASLDTAERDLLDASSSERGARAQLSITRETLSYTELRAGRAGTITARSVEVGQVVQAGQSVYTLAEDGARDAVLRVNEAVANRLGGSSRIAIALVDDPNVRASGVVREISPGIDSNSASVRIRVAIDDAPAAMTLGAPVTGTVNFEAPNTFTVASAAIFADAQEKPAVWVVNPETKAVSLRTIVVGAYETRGIVVKAGLADGDLVVTEGAARLRPAEVVRFDAQERE